MIKNKAAVAARSPLLTFSIFVSELEGLDQTQSFIHRAANGQVVDGDLPQNALVVDHEQTPGRQSGVCNRTPDVSHKHKRLTTLYCYRPTPAMNQSVSSWRHRGSIRPERDAIVLFQHAVVLRDALGQICQKGDFHFTQTSHLSGCVDPKNSK